MDRIKNQGPRCERCKFFVAVEDRAYGYCRRYPPQWGDGSNCQFAVVVPEDWCGEFKYA